MSGIQQAVLGALTFISVTNAYTSGSLATETVPYGARFCRIRLWGAGGGGSGAGAPGGGGGGGGYCELTAQPVKFSDSFTYTIGTGGPGSAGASTDGNPSTVTSAPLSVVMTANGGIAGSGTKAGGTATGGNINTTGSAGTNPTGGASPNGGATQSTLNAAGNAPGGGGAGASAGSGGNGANGRVEFIYT